MKNSFLVLFLSVCFCSPNLFAQRIGFANENWKTIKTEHFDVIFSAEQQDLGLYYAAVAEKAYQNLRTVFTETPSRTVLVINDKTDASNGYATRIPYPIIMAYAVQINDHESLSESGEWARELITHEMTHILQLEPALGFYKFLRPIFGTIVAPNLLLPVWWKEGMAVEMETQFSPRGRLRSLHQDSMLRALQAEEKLFSYSLESVNEVLPSWPYGNRPYIFGSLYFSHLTRNKKLGSIDTLTQYHGRTIPYALNGAMRELGEDSYGDFYLKALLQAKDKADSQIKSLEKLTLTAVKPIPIEGQSSLLPAFSKSLEVLAFLESVDGDPEITFLKKDGTYFEDLKNRPTGQINSLFFHPTLPQLFFTKIERLNSKETFSDIYAYDLSNDTVVRVTRGQRARDLRFSDDGKKLIFITTFNGKTQIKILLIGTDQVETIASSRFEERFYSPIFWDNLSVLFIQKSSAGDSKLMRFDLKTKNSASTVLQAKAMGFLRKSESKLYFTAADSGVFNIYSSEDLKTSTPVSHVRTGTWSFAVDEASKRIWATVMTSDGFRVQEMPLATVNGKLPSISKNFDDYNNVGKNTETGILEYADYTGADYLWPTYWIPYIAASSSSNGVFVQAQTSGHDPIKIHQYSLLANYQTDIQKGGFIGAYTNSTFKVPFQVGALQTNQTFGSVDQVVTTSTNYLSLAPDIFSINKNLAFQIGLQQQDTSYLTRTRHWGPFVQLNYASYEQNIFQISPETGTGLALRYEKQNGLDGSADYNKVTTTYLKYSSLFLPKHHAVMLRLNAMVTFEPVLSRFGASNSSAFTAADTLIPQFVLRGYIPHQFFGRSLWTANTEYRFPIAKVERGLGNLPAFFMKRLSGAVVADGLGVYKESPKFRLNESYWSAGIEAKLETTIGYILPMNIVLGGYYPFSPLFSDGPQFAFGLQLGGF